MADLLLSDDLHERRHDLCPTCNAVFRLSEGCYCKVCRARHWHNEYCFAMTSPLDIRSFGAKCDGLTDDTPALQAAIRALTETRNGFIERVHRVVQEQASPECWMGVRTVRSMGGVDIGIANGPYAVVVGVQEMSSEGLVRFWVRNLDRPFVEVMPRPALLKEVHDFVPVHLAIEMIDPPAWETAERPTA